MTRVQMGMLFTAALVLQIAAVTLAVLTPGEPLYAVLVVWLTAVFEVLTIAKLWGWLK